LHISHGCNHNISGLVHHNKTNMGSVS